MGAPVWTTYTPDGRRLRVWRRADGGWVARCEPGGQGSAESVFEAMRLAISPTSDASSLTDPVVGRWLAEHAASIEAG